MNAAIKKVYSLSLFKTIWVNLRHCYGKPKVLLYRNAHVVIDRAKITVRKHLSFGGGLFFQPTYVKLEPGSTLDCGNFVFYSGSKIYVGKDASLTLGDGFMADNGTINCYRSVSIGEGVFIAPHVVIRDSHNHTIDRPGFQKEGAVVIGDHVWIGECSMILAGVTIGEGAVVAAGSIVTKNVPPHAMVAGVPAIVIREQVNWY